jgi:hypothetical protein
MAEAVAPTPGPYTLGRYGRIGWEIQGGGRSLAVVNRVAEKYQHFVETDAGYRNRVDTGAPGQRQRELAELEATAAEAFATACLLAAAPDLLNACQEALAWIEQACARDEGWMLECLPNGSRGRIVLREAIAKATTPQD